MYISTYIYIHIFMYSSMYMSICVYMYELNNDVTAYLILIERI